MFAIFWILLQILVIAFDSNAIYWNWKRTQNKHIQCLINKVFYCGLLERIWQKNFLSRIVSGNWNQMCAKKKNKTVLYSVQFLKNRMVKKIRFEAWKNMVFFYIFSEKTAMRHWQNNVFLIQYVPKWNIADAELTIFQREDT